MYTRIIAEIVLNNTDNLNKTNKFKKSNLFILLEMWLNFKAMLP